MQLYPQAMHTLIFILKIFTVKHSEIKGFQILLFVEKYKKPIGFPKVVKSVILCQLIAKRTIYLNNDKLSR